MKDTPKVSYFLPQYSNKTKAFVPGWTPTDIDIYDFFKEIKEGKYKDKIDKIRRTSDANEKKIFKTQNLPMITPGAKCKVHRNTGETEPTNIICIDADDDHNPHIKDWEIIRDQIVDYYANNCVGAFISASGKGVAVFLKYKGNHSTIYNQLAWELKDLGIVLDAAPKNIVSGRFASYDPNTYINYEFDTLTFKEVSEQYLEFKKSEDKKLRVVRNNLKEVVSADGAELFENACIIAKAEGNVFEQGTGTKLITSIAGYCNSRGMKKERCKEFFLNHFGTSEYYSHDKIEYHIYDIYERYEEQFGTISFNAPEVKTVSFFDILKGKLAVNRGRFIEFLSSRGIGLLFLDNKTYILARLNGWFFEEIKVEYLKKSTQEHLNNLSEPIDHGVKKTELLECLYKGSDSFFSKPFLEFLPTFKPQYLEDTKETCYLPFKNGIVRISSERIELCKYDDIKKHLWKDAVIDFDITIQNEDLHTGVWYKFLSCICGGSDPTKLTTEQTTKLFNLFSLSGYLIHKFKDPARPYCVILAEQTETEEKGGGTGKGLFAKGLEKVSSLCQIPGKAFDPTDRFAWQRLQIQDNLIVIDDVPKKFSFESLYNVITEGITVERKNQDQFFIPYRISPKIVLISNYVISGAGNHAIRRQKMFEFSPFFSPKYTPEQHFNQLLFQDWTQHEWSKFYNLQIFCVKQYLKTGLLETEKSDTLKKREITQKYSEDFTSWFFDYYNQNGCESWQSVTALHEKFLAYSGMDKKEYTLMRFKSATLYATESWGHTFENRRNRQEANRKEIRIVKKEIKKNVQT